MKLSNIKNYILPESWKRPIHSHSRLGAIKSRFSREYIRKREKVFVIGMQKTGTTSMGDFLELLGYRMNRFNQKRFTIRSKDQASFLNSLKQFDGSEDEPCALWFREIHQKFPESKFILTVRDEDAWINSCIRYFSDYHGWRSKVHPAYREQSAQWRKFLFGENEFCPKKNRDFWISRYRAHNIEVQEYFKSAESKLFVWKTGETSTTDLLEWMGKGHLEVTFPHSNQNR